MDNRRVYERSSIVAQYARDMGLTPTEEAILTRCRSSIADKDVLDLGVGAGRTTPWLAERATSYVGLDFSREMVAVSRQRFPGYDFRWADARDLSAFAAASFDFVLFSFNGIDSVDHPGRLRILVEIARVLRPGGMFVFSTHNLDALNGPSFARELFRIPVSANPLRLSRALARVAFRCVNYARNRSWEVRADGYAILNDPAHDFALCHYYINAAAQKRQLAQTGFLPEADVTAVDAQSLGAPYALYYVAQRA